MSESEEYTQALSDLRQMHTREDKIRERLEEVRTMLDGLPEEPTAEQVDEVVGEALDAINELKNEMWPEPSE